MKTLKTLTVELKPNERHQTLYLPLISALGVEIVDRKVGMVTIQDLNNEPHDVSVWMFMEGEEIPVSEMRSLRYLGTLWVYTVPMEPPPRGQSAMHPPHRHFFVQD